MKLTIIRCMSILTVIGCLWGINPSTVIAGTPLRAGAAKVKITPDYPVQMEGYGVRLGFSTGVHDDIFARAVVFESDGVQAVIVTLDICNIGDEFRDKVLKRLRKEYGLPAEHIMLCATHTHGAPRTISPPWFYEGLKEKPSWYEDFKDGPSEVTKRFTQELYDHIVTAVGEALRKLEPARVGFGSGALHIGVNRRARSVSGETFLGQNPEGPVDRSLPVVRVESLAGKTLAILFEGGVHGTATGSKNYLISGDWCGLASLYVEEQWGDDVVAPFLAGASANVNPIYHSDKGFGTTNGEIEVLGIMAGEEVVRVAKDIKYFSQGPVIATQRDVRLPGKEYKSYDVPAPDVSLRMSALKVGNVVFTGASGEIVCQIGMAVKDQSPYRHTLFISNCNGYTGYVPTDEIRPKGGMEVRNSRIMKGGDRAIIDTLLEMISNF